MPTWSLRPVNRRRRTGRGLRAAVASMVVPGSGQLLVGARRRGWVLCGISALLIAGGAAVWLRWTPTELIAFVLHPTVLLGLVGVNLVLLALRLFATFDAYAVGARPPADPPLPRSRRGAFGTAVALLALLALTAAPHAALGYYMVAAHGVISSVFAADASDRPIPVVAGPPGEPAPGPDDRQVPDLEVDAPTDPDERPSAAPDGSVEISGVEEPPEPPPPPDNPWLDAGRITVALLGSDAGPGRGGDRIDSLMVATIDPQSGDAALFSVDRYLAGFPLPERLEDVYAEHCPFGDGWRYILALYRCGHERVPEEFAALYPDAGDPAAAAVADTLSQLLGIPVPHYAMVDMTGFVRVVDALGGVEVKLAEPLRVRMSPAEPGTDWYTVDLPAGVQELDGREALAFARVRERDGGDADRMRRQRCLVNSVATRTDVPALLLGFPRIAEAIEEHVTTSIPLSRLPDLLEVLPRIDTDRTVAIGFGPPEYRGPGHVPDVEGIRERVQQVLADPDAALEEAATVEAGDEVCG